MFEEQEEKENKEKKDFEARQNAVGFFNVLLKVAKRNSELWKQICIDETVVSKPKEHLSNKK
jgi:hypothetical protein